jgi:tetratricopeptide (TPR) repeat protein
MTPVPSPGTSGKILKYLALLVLAAIADIALAEPAYPADAFAKLDTFEAIQLEDADKLFTAKDYKGAFAAYRAFASEFTRSEAIPYALLRNARCLHLLNRRNNAIQAYQEVVDFFPNAIPFAAAALYYQGLAHGENGNNDRQTAVWARMVQNDAYVSQPNSGTALTFLADEMQKVGRLQEAADYNWRTAVSFRNTNIPAADRARNAVTEHYVRHTPNHDKLKQFYSEAGGFDYRHDKTDAPEEDARYWSRVLDLALTTPLENDQRANVCAYWTAKMGDRFTDNDALRKRWFDALLTHEKDLEKWLDRLVKQYQVNPPSMARVLEWSLWLREQGDALTAFYTRESKPFITAMEIDEKLKLINTLSHHHYSLNAQAEELFRSIGNQSMTDTQLRDYGMIASRYEPEDTVLRIFARIKDKTAASRARFDYHTQGGFRGNRDHNEKALAEIPTLKASPDHAGPNLAWTEAELLQNLGRHEDAIQAYRNANRQPDSTWRIIDCLVALTRTPDAIRSARELESLGKDIAPRAALRIADIYKGAGDKAREISQLRQILVRYPKTSESSQAHLRLEDYQVPLVGGQDDEIP